MSTTLLTTLAQATATKLASLIQADGTFLYKYKASQPSKASTKRYNILRHAGAVWALNRASSSVPFTADQQASIDSALAWLIRQGVPAVAPQPGLCLPENGKIKLGAGALAAVAILSSPRPSGALLAPLLNGSGVVENLCEYILRQATAGTFTDMRDASTGAALPFKSEYYTGQALFAVMSAARAYPKLTGPQAGYSLFLALAAQGYGVKQQNHWMMYAAEVAFQIEPGPSTLAYAGNMAQAILKDTTYKKKGDSTPIACRSEALLSYLRILKSAGAASPSSAQIKTELTSNLALQMNDRQSDGSFAQKKGKVVRIDYLQHNLEAMLGYAEVGS